jgi:hypothetical protein
MVQHPETVAWQLPDAKYYFKLGTNASPRVLTTYETLEEVMLPAIWGDSILVSKTCVLEECKCYAMNCP